MAAPNARPQSAAQPQVGGAGPLHARATATTATKYASPMHVSSAARCACPKTRGMRISEIAAATPAGAPYHTVATHPQKKTVRANAAAEPTRAQAVIKRLCV